MIKKGSNISPTLQFFPSQFSREKDKKSLLLILSLYFSLNFIKNINSLLSDISNIINVSNLNYLRNRNPSFPRFSSNPVQEEGEIDHPSTIFILRTVQRCPAPVNPTFARYGRNTLVKSSREQQTCTSSIQGRNVQQETAKRIFFDDSSSFDIVQLKSRKLDSGGWGGGAMAPNDRPLFVVLE